MIRVKMLATATLLVPPTRDRAGPATDRRLVDVTDPSGSRSEEPVGPTPNPSAGDQSAGDPTAPDATRPDRILTAANVITVGRLLLLPLFVWLLFARDDPVWAAIVLATAGATDFVDGYVARHFDQGSELGKILDPVADRVLFFVGVTAILIDGAAPAWFCVAVLARETVVASTTLVLAAMGAPRIDVTWWGKAGTFALMVAFPWFLFGSSDLESAEMWEQLAWLVGIPGLFLSYLAAFLYLPLVKLALEKRRAARAAAT